VPELSHDTAEDGFHEIQLSGKQLVFLFIVTTTVVVGVFLFGVLVGRGARPAPAEESPAAAVTSPAPEAPRPVTQSPSSEVPQPAPEGPDDLSGTAALKQKSSPATGLTPSTETKTATAETKPAPLAAPPPARPPISSVPKEPEPKPAPAAVVAKPSVAATADVPRSAASGVWLVQVIATRDQAVATSVVKKLASKGYPAFLVNPVAGAPQPFFKVQVGRYRERTEAERVSQRIKKEEQFQSWILR
jgi:cell division septation protein DedD